MASLHASRNQLEKTHITGPRRRLASMGWMVLAMTLVLAGSLLGIRPVAAAEAPPQSLGYPAWTGSTNPVPTEPVRYEPEGMMQAIYDKEKSGTNFWMDRLLERKGADPAGDWMMSRGRAVFMKVHDPSVIGFGGQVAYWESINNRGAYAITIAGHTFTEDVSQRYQTPSYWKGTYSDGGTLRAVVTKFITEQNVAVTELALTNTAAAAATVALSVTSPYANRAQGSELVGTVQVKNNITTVFPRLAATGLMPEGQALTGSLTIKGHLTVTTKVVMGFTTREIPESTREFNTYKALDPQMAFAKQVRDYNKWWADNIPYIDVPDNNIKKNIYYRWWLMRFNFLDANAPGQAYQMPTSVEGALGYNNAIDLTLPMFINDLTYLRNPIYSYGPWLQAGEVAKNGRFRDNPGDPENWNTSHSQYIAEAAWNSYQVHGGPLGIVQNYAQYASGDAKGELASYDKNDDGVLDISGTAWTGNDADAVSYDYKPGATLGRPESADVYSGATSAAQAYDLLGDPTNAATMRALASKVQNGIINNLWDPKTKMIESQILSTGELDPWKEANNYEPYTVGLMPNTPDYREAFRLYGDPNEFPIFPFYTADQSDKAAAAAAGRPGSNNFSVINSTRAFRFLASALRNYPSEYLTPEMFKKLLYWNAYAQFVNGDNRWPDANEFWSNYNEQTQQIEYRSWIHHTILGSSNWTIIEDVAGLQPRTDNKIELSPIDIGWDHFAVNNLNYHGQNLDVVWDSPKTKKSQYPGVPKGLSIYLDGKRVLTVDRLAHIVFDPSTGKMTGEGVTTSLAKGVAFPAAENVNLDNARIDDIFQKAGRDLKSTGKATNVALGATPSASFTAPTTSVTGANDGYTIVAPYWGTKGSTTATDWYQLTFPTAQTVDDAKLYFYDDRQPGGYAQPQSYSVQYLNNGAWVDVKQQQKSPTYPEPNYNHVTFPSVRTTALRVVLTHQPGYASGLTEFQAFDTGKGSPPARNYAPLVTAWISGSQAAVAQLTGEVLDDGLPSAKVTTSWTAVSGPGIAIFDDPSKISTSVRFSKGGSYLLRLSASDGIQSSSADVVVTVAGQSAVVDAALTATSSASYTSSWEHVTAINDGIDPPASNDTVNTRWGTWPQQGTQWVQLDWASPVHVNSSDMYFFADGGGVLAPKTWSIQYWNATTNAWVDVTQPSGYPTDLDKYNHTTFDSVTTTKMRATLVANGASVGIDEWKVNAVAAQSVREVEQPTLFGTVPKLPGMVQQTYDDGAVGNLPVSWQTIQPSQVANGGTSFPVEGIISGSNLTAHATVYVRTTDAVDIVSLTPEPVNTKVGVPPQLPPTVVATYNDGSRDNVSTSVTWDPVDPSSFAIPGTFQVSGTVNGTGLKGTANVTVT